MNIFDLKTTITGLILLAISIYCLTITVNIYLTAGLFITAIGLIVAPDTIIEDLKLIIQKLINKV